MKFLNVPSRFMKFGEFQRRGHNDKEVDPRHIKRIEGSDSIFLTFDLCPTHKVDRSVIDYLIDNKIEATFFVNVQWLLNNDNKDLSFFKNPLFSIGGHGYDHIDPLRQSDEEQCSDIISAIDELENRLQTKIKWYRVPYGHPTEATFKLFKELRIKYASWSGPVFDKKADYVKDSSNVKAENYMNLSMRSGDIILMHANGEGQGTVKMLEDLSIKMKELGYSYRRLPNV